MSELQFHKNEAMKRTRGSGVGHPAKGQPAKQPIRQSATAANQGIEGKNPKVKKKLAGLLKPPDLDITQRASSLDSSIVSSGCRVRVIVSVRPENIEVYEPQELDSGEEEDSKNLKNLQDVIRIYGDEVDTAKSYLQMFLKEVYHPELAMSPYKSFVMRQTSLAAYSIAARMKTNRLQYLDVRDHLENLASLFDFMQIRNKPASGYLAMLLSRLIGFIGPIAEVLEDIAKKHVTDWLRLEEFYMMRYEDLEIENRINQECLYVPYLNEFTYPTLREVGNFSSGFSVWYGNTVEMYVKTAYRKRITDNRSERCSRNRKLMVSSTQIGCMAKHALIAQVYSCFLSTSHYLMVMEHVNGVNLLKLVESSTVLTEEVSAVIFAQLCLAVEYLHYVGFIHRNLCAENIMVSKMCRVRIIDFANLKACSGMYSVRMLQTYRKRTSKEFNDVEVVGTLQYRAPEKLQHHPYGRAIDWWAVGVVAFFMKFGYVPFRGETESELISEILSGTVHANLENDGSPNMQLSLTKSSNSLKTTGRLYNDLIQRLLRVKVNSRLNSKTYDEYRRHGLFELLNWEALERAEEILLVPLVSEILEAPAKDWCENSTKNSAICTSFESLKDCSKQFALYTFNSAGFLRIQEAFYKGEQVTAEMLEEPVELIGTFRDNEPYKFQEWYKSTRL